MKKTKFLLLVIILSTLSFAINAQEVYNHDVPVKFDSIKVFYPKWRINDNFKLISKMIVETSPSTYDSAHKFEIINTYTLTVNDSTENGFILSFKNLNSKIISEDVSPSFPLEMVFDEFGKLTKGIDFKLLFGVKGEYVDFLNFEEASTIYLAMVDSIKNKILKGEFGGYGTAGEETYKELKMRYSNKERAADEYLKFILPYFDVYNKEFFINEGNPHREYMVLKETNDSIYYNNTTTVVSETEQEIQLFNAIYFDDDQKEKLLNAVSSNQEDQMVLTYLETLANSRQENSFVIQKSSNWIRSYGYTIIFKELKQSFCFEKE